jgi:hypothetical protein
VTVPSTGGDDIELNVATTSSCAWTAVSQASWISIRGASSGTGNARLRLAVEPTLQVGGRVGQLVVGGQTVTVNQAGILNQEVTIRGTVRNLSGSCPSRTFSIDGTTIVADGRTEYRGRNDCQAIVNGGHARVRGVGQADGTVRATRIDQIDDDDLMGVGPIGDRQ